MSSTDINVRTKRSKNSANQSRRQGCSLGTCTVHDLAHRLHQLNNKLKIGSAPVDKISPQGYGRRRRSLPAHRVTLRLEQGRLRPVWSITDSQVHKLEALLRRTWAGLCKRSREQTQLSSWELVIMLLCTKILKMPQIAAKYSPAHFFQAWELSQSKIGSTEFFKSLSLAAQRCRACKQLQLAYRHWMAWRGANYRCCSLLGRGKGRVQILGKEDPSSGLSGNSLLTFWDFYTFLPKGQNFDKCYPLRIIPPCTKLSVLICTFPFGLKIKWIIRKRYLHHNAKQEDRLRSSEALSLY